MHVFTEGGKLLRKPILMTRLGKWQKRKILSSLDYHLLAEAIVGR
jgi:hypothetical protein